MIKHVAALSGIRPLPPLSHYVVLISNTILSPDNNIRKYVGLWAKRTFEKKNIWRVPWKKPSLKKSLL